jgi:aryl-alcohol dehydrogenase-like predicted oxidoreductase
MKKKLFSRRQFMSAMTAGTGTLLLGKTALAFSPGTSLAGTDPYQIVTLGKSGLRTTLLGMGTGYSGYNKSSSITRAGRDTAIGLIRYAYESGIRFFDCADAYGTHPYTMEALKNFPRESYTLCSKILVSRSGVISPENPGADVLIDRFRKELNTDYIDLIQIHLMTSGKWTDEQKKQMDILETLKAKKIIRAHGVSVHSLEAMRAAAASPWVDVIHCRINPFGVSMDSSDPDEVVPVMEQMHKSGIGIIGMKLIGNGSYRDNSAKIDQTVSFVLGLGSVDVMIVGFEFPHQIDNFASRIRSIKPSSDKI